MINLKYELTVDDLIVEYMAYKVKNGYEPEFTASEFRSFLDFFQSKMKVKDVIDDNERLFKRFFVRKNKNDWRLHDEFGKIIEVPHMDMVYSTEIKDYVIKAGYRLSDYDMSVINTYFMGSEKRETIRDIIKEYLLEQPKRKIDEYVLADDNDLLVGKYFAAYIIENIWYSYIEEQKKYHKWPYQCSDINKYLFDIDLAEIIDLKSIKKDLIEVYNVISKRIAILYKQDRDLKITSYSNLYLSKANYELLIQGYEDVFDKVFGAFKNNLKIDITSMIFIGNHEMYDIYDLDEDPNVVATETTIKSDKVKNLIKNIEKISNK